MTDSQNPSGEIFQILIHLLFFENEIFIYSVIHHLFLINRKRKETE